MVSKLVSIENTVLKSFLSLFFYVVTVVLALNLTKPDILFGGTHELVRIQVRRLLAIFNSLLVTIVVTLKSLF